MNEQNEQQPQPSPTAPVSPAAPSAEELAAAQARLKISAEELDAIRCCLGDTEFHKRLEKCRRAWSLADNRAALDCARRLIQTRYEAALALASTLDAAKRCAEELKLETKAIEASYKLPLFVAEYFKHELPEKILSLDVQDFRNAIEIANKGMKKLLLDE